MLIFFHHHGSERAKSGDRYSAVTKQVRPTIVIFQSIFSRPFVYEIVVGRANPSKSKTVYLQ